MTWKNKIIQLTYYQWSDFDVELCNFTLKFFNQVDFFEFQHFQLDFPLLLPFQLALPFHFTLGCLEKKLTKKVIKNNVLVQMADIGNTKFLGNDDNLVKVTTLHHSS